MIDCYKDSERLSNKQYWAGVYPFNANVLHFVLLCDGNDSVGNDNLQHLWIYLPGHEVYLVIYDQLSFDKFQPQHNETFSFK